MRVSLRWLRDYAPLDAPLETLCRMLVDTGTEVDAVHRVADGAVVARVTALEPVPGARSLRFADIDTGAGAPTRVVSGAANVVVGDLVPYAPPGVLLPGWASPLEARRFRIGGTDISSPGMLCSADELGVGEDASGLLVLERGTPGQPVADVLALDSILEVDVTSNRPDCLCHLGIARELTAALGERLTPPSTTVPGSLLSAGQLSERVRVAIGDPTGCPRFTGRVIESVAVGPSPPWLQQRLRAIGQRPINNVVDVTNFVAAELGQPLHAFDLDRLRALSAPAPAAGAPTTVVVRRARPGERLRCLDGVERELDSEDLAVCAGERPVSIGGIIGGAESAVDAASRTIMLEAATWEGARILASSRRLGVRTEASSRNEKGLSDSLPPAAQERAAALIAELGGGHVLRGAVDEHPAPLPAIRPIRLPGGFLDRILGVHVDPSEAATALVRLGFSVAQEPDALVVEPPTERRDVVIPEDVVEEVGRSLGYERVPSTLPGRRVAVGELAQAASPVDLAVDAVCGAGFSEAITYSFTSPRVLARLEGMGAGRTPITLRNPLSEEWSVMRTSLLPGLCSALALNTHRGVAEVALFEVGRAYWEGERVAPVVGGDGDDAGLPPLPLEPLLLSLVSQAGDGDGETAAAELRRLQAVLAWLADEIGGKVVSARPAELGGLREGRSACVVDDAGGNVGVLGELSAVALEGFGLRGRVVAAELRLDAVLPAAPLTPRFVAPPRFPPIIQDLTVSVADAAAAGEALGLIRRAGQGVIESAELRDEYRSAGLGAGSKSWTFRLVFRAADRTLTSAEAQASQAAIAEALRAGLGAELRR